jgi:hypothetical protein
MDTLIVPITDIIKHMIDQTYLTYEDKKLNMMLYCLVGVVLSLISKKIIKFNPINFCKYINWIINFGIKEKKIFCYPCEDLYYTPYDMNTTDTSELYTFEQIIVQMPYFQILMKTLYKINQDHVDTNNTTMRKSIYRFGSISNNFNFNIKYNINDIFNVAKQYKNNIYVIAYINGYNIYIVLDKNINNNDSIIRFFCKKQDCIKIFLDFVSEKHKEFFPTNIITRDVYEASSVVGTPHINIGLVKTQLTFDNYVSRFKKTILTYLDNFKNHKINEDNIFIDNNLGFLVYGTYGTGKTFLISAIANYLNRSIFNINFARIKTKSKFREIMSPDNIEKYVYCFDEFDYLLTNVIKSSDSKEAESDVKFKIQALSSQLIAVRDNERACEEISKQIKTLMEDGISDNITYEFILSELSGITSVQNRIIVATTNFIDNIPKALLRPGRFDVVLHLDTFNKEEIIELLIKLYKPSEKEINKLDFINFKQNKFTPADIIMNKTNYPTLTEMIKYLSN